MESCQPTLTSVAGDEAGLARQYGTLGVCNLKVRYVKFTKTNQKPPKVWYFLTKSSGPSIDNLNRQKNVTLHIPGSLLADGSWFNGALLVLIGGGGCPSPPLVWTSADTISTGLGG